MSRKQNSKRRSGYLIQEAVATIAVTLAVLAGVTQLLGLTSRHRAAVQQRQMAARELGNVMERVMAIPWADLTPEKTSSLPVSAACQAVLREPKLQVAIVPDSATEDLVQIRVQIDWPNAAGQRARPVQLVAWRYRQEEATP